MLVVMHPPEASWVSFVTLCFGDCIYAGEHGWETSILSQRFLLTVTVTPSETQERGGAA